MLYRESLLYIPEITRLELTSMDYDDFWQNNFMVDNT